MKNIIFILIFYLILFANVDDKININLEKDIIQVGAFKKNKSIQYIKKTYSKYTIFVKKFPNDIKKVYIVNINKNNLLDTLNTIKKDIPKAFVISKKQKYLLFKNEIKNDLLNKNLKNENYFNKLDSKAIIKTRKKFFQ